MDKDKKVLTRKELIEKVERNLKGAVKELITLEQYGVKLDEQTGKFKDPAEIRKLVEDMLKTGSYQDLPLLEDILQKGKDVGCGSKKVNKN